MQQMLSNPDMMQQIMQVSQFSPHTMAVCGIRSVSCPDQLQSQMQGGAAGAGGEAGGLGGMATPNPQVMAQMMQVWGLIRVMSSWRGEH